MSRSVTLFTGQWADLPLEVLALRASNPYGKIVALADGTLILPIYGPPQASILGDRFGELDAEASCSYLVRSHDDGLTWGVDAFANIQDALDAAADTLAGLQGAAPEPGPLLRRLLDDRVAQSATLRERAAILEQQVERMWGQVFDVLRDVPRDVPREARREARR